MKLLLDTCTFLWLIKDSPELSSSAEELIRNSENTVYLSSVSAWEIGIKYLANKLPLPEDPKIYIPKQRTKHLIESLGLDEASTLFYAHLPAYHPDPFDRILICQAIINDMILMTPDTEIKKYPVKTFW